MADVAAQTRSPQTVCVSFTTRLERTTVIGQDKPAVSITAEMPPCYRPTRRIILSVIQTRSHFCWRTLSISFAEGIHQQDKVSTTDPDSTYLTKGNRAAELGYFDNYLIDNESCVIVGVQATAARLSQESAAARDMIDRYYERYGRRPMGVAAEVAADTPTATGKCCNGSMIVGLRLTFA
jgi:hypothetical protein